MLRESPVVLFDLRVVCTREWDQNGSWFAFYRNALENLTAFRQNLLTFFKDAFRLSLPVNRRRWKASLNSYSASEKTGNSSPDHWIPIDFELCLSSENSTYEKERMITLPKEHLWKGARFLLLLRIVLILLLPLETGTDFIPPQWMNKGYRSSSF